MKRRILRLAITILVVLLFTGYFAFSTLFFSPLEGDYPFDIASLISRDVDFYVAKAELRDDFDERLRPRVADEFRASPRGQALVASDEYTSLAEDLGIEDALAQLDELVAQMPIEAEPLGIFGGRDLALAGYFEGRGFDQAQWAVYGRANWMGKLGVALLDYPGLLGDSGLEVTELEYGRSIAGPSLARTLYVSRVQDVIILATREDFLAKASELEASRGENSLERSAKYGDHIALADHDKNSLEVYADYRALSEGMQWPGTWPDKDSDEFGTAFLGRLFQIGAIRELIGNTGFGNGLRLRLHGMLSSETMTPFQKRLYRTRGFDAARILAEGQVAQLAPANSGVFAYGHGSVGDLLREAKGCAEEALVANLEDLVRSVWGHPDLEPLIDDLATAFKSRFALIVRDNDYPDDLPNPDTGDVGGPPHNDVEVQAWALVLWVDEREKLEELQLRILNHQDSFGISGPTPGSKGVFTNKVQGGSVVHEYWSEFIDGTGHIATLELQDFFIISNHHKMLGQIVSTYYHGSERGSPRLSEDSWFVSQVNDALPSANFLVWLNPRAVAKSNRAIARQLSELDVVIDWGVERPRIERKVFKEQFPGETWGQLSPSKQDQLDMLVQPELDAFEREFRNQHVPALLDRRQKRLEASEAVRGILCELAISQKEFDLHARVILPLDEPLPPLD